MFYSYFLHSLIYFCKRSCTVRFFLYFFDLFDWMFLVACNGINLQPVSIPIAQTMICQKELKRSNTTQYIGDLEILLIYKKDTDLDLKNKLYNDIFLVQVT